MLGFRYLYRNRSGVFFYRYQLPGSAAAVFGRREVKKSLRTESRAVALPAALSLHSSVTSLVEMAKKLVQFSSVRLENCM